MSNTKKRIFKDKRTVAVFVIVSAIILVFTVFACYKYYKQVKITVTDESTQYMNEITNQMGTNAGRVFKNNFAVLGTISTAIKNTDNLDKDKWKTIALEQQKYWEFNSVMLISEQGIGIDGNGKRVELFNDTFLKDAIINRKTTMSASQNIDGMDCIIFIAPIDNVSINGVQSLALATSYQLSTFDQILSLTAFDSQCYAHIIRSDGVVVIRSSSEYARDTGYNLLNSLEEAKFSDKITIDNVKLDIASGISGIAEYSLDDVKEYMIYKPLTMDGWAIAAFVPLSVVNQKSQVLLVTTLIMGAVIALVFLLLVVSLVITYFINKRRLEKMVFVDSVTGGNTIQKFYQLSQEILFAHNKTDFAILYINIQKFKIFNEQYGRVECDKILKLLSSGISAQLSDNECIGRLMADTFCALIEYSGAKELVQMFNNWYSACSKTAQEQQIIWLPLVFDCGIYPISDKHLSIAHMIDRAKLALTKSSTDVCGRIHYSIYDDNARKKLFREKHLEDIMEDALQSEEFQVYLQPKYNTTDFKVSGAEALVRWQNNQNMIYPDEFIALFEKNGFIVHLDLYVFTVVCKTIKKWLDSGLVPIKTSVNCSRVHLKNPHFVEEYCAIASEYNIPPQYIELELTESMMFEDIEQIKIVINKIHAAGFGCSMDDFGSGYSSFNLLQEIPVDTIKLDKIFFKKGKDVQRTESVVSGIISMSKSLNMRVVAEGVEEKSHVDMLKRLNCDFIQGYFFAKPMPIIDFEALVY